MEEIAKLLSKAAVEFAAHYVTFNAVASWVSIHVIMQAIKRAADRWVNGRIKKALDFGKHFAAYFLGVVAALVFDVFPEVSPKEQILAGIVLGAVASEAHKWKKRLLGKLEQRYEDDEKRSALISRVKNTLT